VFSFSANATTRMPRWEFSVKLTAPDAAEYDAFGTAVSTDGNYLAIGAPFHGTGARGQAGQAYVYRNGFWGASQVAIVRSPSPAISDFFGSTIVVYKYVCLWLSAPRCLVACVWPHY
jgi:hypothetical protein